MYVRMYVYMYSASNHSGGLAPRQYSYTCTLFSFLPGRFVCQKMYIAAHSFKEKSGGDAPEGIKRVGCSTLHLKRYDGSATHGRMCVYITTCACVYMWVGGVHILMHAHVGRQSSARSSINIWVTRLALVLTPVRYSPRSRIPRKLANSLKATIRG